MRRAIWFLLGIAAALAVVLIAVVTHTGLKIEQLRGPGRPAPVASGDGSADGIAARLLEAGVHPTGLLDDLGVDDHMAWLREGSVTAGTLDDYAGNLEALTAKTVARGWAFPVPFWDVETQAMRDAGWNVYTIAAALASPDGEPHLDLLADAYDRFLAKRPDALAAALDIMLIARDYVAATPEESRVERADLADTEEKATILIWQALLSGTSRTTPVTHRPLWSHGFIGHFSIHKVHQYATGRGMSLVEVWGVGGFDPRFVGPESNGNQVEHLGISTMLQAVVGVRPEMLEAVEGFEILAAGEDLGAARADDALNLAIHSEFVPHYQSDLPGAVERLRRVLSGGAD